MYACIGETAGKGRRGRRGEEGGRGIGERNTGNARCVVGNNHINH